MMKRLFSHPLFLSGTIMVVGSNFVNALNYLYNLVMGRLLGPAGYGELASIFSIVNLVGIINMSLGLVITRFVAAAKNDIEIKGLVKWFQRIALLLAGLLFLATSLGSRWIAEFLNLDVWLIVLLSLVWMFIFPAFVNKAALQGLLKFKQIIASLSIESILKLVLGVAMVIAGFSVAGALGAFIVAALVNYLMTVFFIRNYADTQAIEPKNTRPMFVYAIPLVVQSLTLASLYSTDLLLVKHFFSAHQAGIYAAMSNLGKIIFFGAGPISQVMFPVVSRRQSQGQGYQKVILLSIVSTLVLSLMILAIYWLLPDLTIRIFYGALFLGEANLLIWFGVFMTLFTLASLLINFHLSINQTSVVILPTLAAIAQVIGIWLHHRDLMTVILVSVAVALFLLISLVGFFFINYRSPKR